MNPTQKKWCQSLAILLVAIATIPAQGQEEESNPLTVKAYSSVEEGNAINIECTSSNESLEIQWYFNEAGGEGLVFTNNSTQRIYVEDGTLIITNAMLNDSGIYVCHTSNLEYNTTAELKVYIMPSYFEEGMIIMGINAGLVLIFLICFLYTFIRSKQERKQIKKLHR